MDSKSKISRFNSFTMIRGFKLWQAVHFVQLMLTTVNTHCH